MNSSFIVNPNNFRSLLLFGLSLCNYGLMYWANIFLVHHLNTDGFADFSVAISVVTLLSSLSTLGLEKYALRVVALNIERQRWERLRNFLRFSMKSIALTSLALLLTMSVTLESILAWKHADFHIAIVVYAAFLPIIAISLFLVEIVTVFGFQVLALAVYRLLLPVSFIALVLLLQRSDFELSASTSVVCLGLAWSLTFASLAITTYRTCPKLLRQTGISSRDKVKWIGKALPLLINSLMMTIINNAGPIVLHALQPSGFQVGLFAVVMQTSVLVALIGTSTNRYYLPMLMVLLERRDAKGTKQLLFKRMQLISGFITLYLSAIFAFGSEILDWFGPDFTDGYLALCVCTLGASVNTLFSDTPYYLQFMGQSRLVVALTGLTTVCMLILSIMLSPHYGATGVAVAYALPITLLFCTLKFFASRHLRRHLTINAPNQSDRVSP
ncbi:MAG: lipopolysaccharide biosynthesis protein [Gammaproteobacteria bacterium]